MNNNFLQNQNLNQNLLYKSVIRNQKNKEFLLDNYKSFFIEKKSKYKINSVNKIFYIGQHCIEKTFRILFLKNAKNNSLGNLNHYLENKKNKLNASLKDYDFNVLIKKGKKTKTKPIQKGFMCISKKFGTQFFTNEMLSKFLVKRKITILKNNRNLSNITMLVNLHNFKPLIIFKIISESSDNSIIYIKYNKKIKKEIIKVKNNSSISKKQKRLQSKTYENKTTQKKRITKQNKNQLTELSDNSLSTKLAKTTIQFNTAKPNRKNKSKMPNNLPKSKERTDNTK